MRHGQRKSATSKLQAGREAKKETGLLTSKRRRACKSRSRSMIQMSSPRNGPRISPTAGPSFPGKSEFVPKTTPMCSTKVSSMFRRPKSRISEQPECASWDVLLKTTVCSQGKWGRSASEKPGPSHRPLATAGFDRIADSTARRRECPLPTQNVPSDPAAVQIAGLALSRTLWPGGFHVGGRYRILVIIADMRPHIIHHARDLAVV